MGRLVVSAGLIGAVWAWIMAVSTGAMAQGLDHACGMPARASCGGCAVSCPASAFAICRAGMSIWRGAAWSCLYQPVCACQQSLWQIWP